jgi:hypothetical protein
MSLVYIDHEWYPTGGIDWELVSNVLNACVGGIEIPDVVLVAHA